MRHALSHIGRRQARRVALPVAGLLLSAGVLLFAAPGIQAAPRAVLGELYSADG